MSGILQISAGRGPAEVRRFAALLARRCAALLGRSMPESPEIGSVQLPLSVGELSLVGPLLGVHELVAPWRGRGQRRRWYCELALLPEAPSELPKARFERRTCRSGGPGGQKANKRDTAVLLIDRSTGLRARSGRLRSQGANLGEARQRLEAHRQALWSERCSLRRQQGRERHDQLRRGAPDHRWCISPDGELEQA